MQRTRFYLQPKETPSGESLAVFVSNLPYNLSQRQYEKILLDVLGKGLFCTSRIGRAKTNSNSTENKYSSIGPIYYEYGSLVLTYQSSEEAIQACYTLKEATFEERSLSGNKFRTLYILKSSL